MTTTAPSDSRGNADDVKTITRDRLISFAGITAMLIVVFGAWLVGPSPRLLGVRAEFLLFGLTLAGVAVLHHSSFGVALTGLLAVTALKLFADPSFHLPEHFAHEAAILTNLLGLLLGFAVLARHFEQSEAPEILPAYLPDN